jgi:hypothetical protein
MTASSGAPVLSRTDSVRVLSFVRNALSQPVIIARATFDRLPAETQMHARAVVSEGIAALRSLADGSTDATERAIDRIGGWLGDR